MTDYEEVKEKVLDIMGIQDYDPRCRKADFVIARILIGNVLLNRKYNQIEVGKMIGVNRACIYYYRERLTDWKAFPGIYQRELNLWNKLQELI